jgi:hypothetical protein
LTTATKAQTLEFFRVVEEVQIGNLDSNF